MLFRETPIAGAWLIDMETREDQRGFFGRLFCKEEMERQGLSASIQQINASFSSQQGTLRGMHYQLAPQAEVKIVRCLRGAIYDVLLDLRPDSPTYTKWFGETLTLQNRTILYVPKGCAHGFITLEDETEILYLVDTAYAPQEERGVRFDDPRFGIFWPKAPRVISEKDRSWPDFSPQWHGVERLRGLL